ncbi:MAG: hypothetical protein D6820_14775, partial [Lentisphaerae bacterium]
VKAPILVVLILTITVASQPHGQSQGINKEPAPSPPASSARQSSTQFIEILQQLHDQDEIDSAIEQGLRWLYTRQNKDGSWGKDRQVRTTAQVIIAFLAAGFPPESSPYTQALQRAAQFLLDIAQENNGWLRILPDESILPHIEALTALALIDGHLSPQQNQLIHQTLKNGLTLLEQTQIKGDGSNQGGWPRRPGEQPDLITTARVLLLLDILHAAQIKTTPQTRELATLFLLAAHRGDGSFALVPGKSQSVPPVWTWLACHCLHYIYPPARERLPLPSIPASRKTWRTLPVDQRFAWSLYAILHRQPSVLQQHHRLAMHLAKIQKKDGSWQSGDIIQTANNLAIMAIRNQYLPIF